MCGIAGIVERTNASIEGSLIRRMTDGMSHRGPDAAGFHEEPGLALGHRRLSIIDLSTAANQPFFDHTGRYVIVFNGEIYNYKEVKTLLPAYPFHTSGDTEVLVAAFAQWGPGCLKYLRGMYAFAIWDKVERELFIARDRLGVKPLYYYADDHRLLFASELRSLLGTGLIPKKVEPKALFEYFSYQSVSYPYSAVAGVEQLEAGSWMKYKDGRIQKEVYWDVSDVREEFDFSNGAAVRDKIRQLLLQSVERRMVSDVPVGAFLSGGIDSSAVVGLMAEAGVARPNTFNVYFEEKEYDESAYADIVAKKFNTNHTRLLLKPTVFLDELENALSAMDSPSGDGVNTYVVSKAIRSNGMTVALSGVGGDELFAGYPFFQQYRKLRKMSALWKLPAGLRKGAAGLLLGAAGGKKDRIRQLLSAESSFIDASYPIFRQILSPGLIQELTDIGRSGAGATAIAQELTARRQQLQRLPELSQVSAAEYLGYTQHTLLKDTDQMSMAVSLEVREPFFDQDLVSFVLSIPDDLKTPAYPKSLLVESLKPLLPDEIVFRKKQGFLFPWNVWLKKDLRSWCEQRIDNMAGRPYIRGNQLKTYWARFLKGDPAVRWTELWLFIVLEYWLEKNDIF